MLAAPAHGEADVFALAAVTSGYVQNLKGSWYADGGWETRDQAVTMVGSTSNRSIAGEEKGGMAMDHAGFFYVAAYRDWYIFQYAWSADDPFTLTYVADVDIWDPCLGESYGGCQ